MYTLRIQTPPDFRRIDGRNIPSPGEDCRYNPFLRNIPRSLGINDYRLIPLAVSNWDLETQIVESPPNLPQAMPLNECIGVACLPSGWEEKPGTNCSITGWGTLKSMGPTPDAPGIFV